MKNKKGDGMKTFKFLLISMSLLFLGSTHANAANVTWLDSSFNYEVGANTAKIYTKANNQNGYSAVQTTVSGDTGSKSKLFDEDGDEVNNSSVTSSASSNDALNLTLKAGATGSISNNGTSVTTNAYLQSSSAQNNGVESGYYGLDSGACEQQVTSYTISRFEVENNAYYNFTASLSGLIDATSWVSSETVNGGMPASYFTYASYAYSGSVSLIQNVIDDDGVVQGAGLSLVSIDLADLLSDDDALISMDELLLLTQLGGERVTYDLRVQLSLDGSYGNFASYLQKNNPWLEIPEDSFGSLGTEEDPLSIATDLTFDRPYNTPVPGSGILLLSGLIGIIGYRNRRS